MPKFGRLRGLAELAFGSLTRAGASTHDQHPTLPQAGGIELDLTEPAQRQFGDYELLERIGEGGMGVVYRARHVPLNRIVAVKLLSAGLWASHDFVQRFGREARNAARMQHPNIVTVFEVGSLDGLHFFSMPLVEGQSLSALLKRGERFAPKAAAVLLRTVAEAVAYAHSVGVLHLDLKPGNILVDADGVPHVADFGLARELDSALTAENDEVTGTPAYMAPEQTRSHAQKLTVATDIYELGAILYELLTGGPPFRAESAQDTLRLVEMGQVRAPRRFRPGLPLDLQAIVMKALDKDPAQRYPSAREFADELGRFIEGRPVHARPLTLPQRVLRWARREPKLASLAFLAFAALLAGLVATYAQSRRVAAVADRAEHTLWASRTATAQREIERGNAYSALVNSVANLREMEAHGNRDGAALERLRIGTVLANAPQLIGVVPVGKDAFVSALAISPDAKTVAAAIADEHRSVRLFDVASGKQTWKVATLDTSFGNMDFNNSPIEDLTFSRDGRRLLAYSIDAVPGGDQSTMRPRTIDMAMIDVTAGRVVSPPKAFADYLAMSFGDDGRHALLFDRHGGIQRWRTLPWAPAGDKVDYPDNINGAPHDGPLMGAARLADDGKTMVLVSEANLRFRTFDAVHMRLQHSLLLDAAQGRATAWALRDDGRQLAIGTVTGQVALWDLRSGDVAWLRSQLPGRIATLRYSPGDHYLLAVSNAPSELRVFDTLSLELVATPVALGQDRQPNVETGITAMFGADDHTLLTRHWVGGATLWQLPGQGFPLHAPVPAAPVMVGMGTRFALASDPHARLMATSDNGQIKLWRLRRPALMDRIAAPMVADTLRFDGRHLVSVDGNRVSVFDITRDRPVGAAMVLPAASTYAGLDGSGERVIAFAGREIYCWNWRSGTRCWPAIRLPDSPLRLGIAAKAPVLAVSTGGNADGKFYEHVHLIDLATGRQRGQPIVLRGPLGALRLSADGHRLLAWQDHGSKNREADRLFLIDADNATIIARMLNSDGDRQQVIFDACFQSDGSIWSQSGAPWSTVDGSPSYLWHWAPGGSLIAKLPSHENWGALLLLPDLRGIVMVASAQLITAQDARVDLNAPDSNSRDNAGAISPDGRLLALATIDGVALTDIAHNERLLPDMKLPLPYHDVVQQLAFAPDGSRLVGRTTSGRWFQWPLVADARPVTEIARDVDSHDFTSRDVPPPALTDRERQLLRHADPGPDVEQAVANVGGTTASVSAPLPDPRFLPLDLDPVANVDPRRPMNHATRLPPQPQNLPGLPRGLQRYDGVDFLLGRAVQLSGQPRNILDAEFPASSRMLATGTRRVAHVDVLVMQYLARLGVVGDVHLHYRDGGERVLAITSPDEVREHWMDAATNPASLQVGWVGGFGGQMLTGGPNASGSETLSRTYVVRLANPEPNRPVASISFSAPPDVSPGLLFLAVTLELKPPDQRGTR
ncbi:MAG TPA: WD40 repeat domain-containing serine/threonine protein kinase [Rhodanobacteraceae bacterium]|nr:WD40 repeat domain-containing serine/threonine protein kinase [Rhodanobacteraceae bacterium]